MASHPPGLCCFKGVKHEGQPVGTLTKVKDFEVYISQPENKSTDNAILFVTDVFGHKFINAQLMADQFAANGYFVFVPDLFHADPARFGEPGFDLYKWLENHTKETVDPVVEASIAELREKYNVKTISAVGYCFGAKYVIRHLRPQQKKIDVGFVAHPSFVESDELKAIEGPLAIAAAEVDEIFPNEKRHESEIILKESGLPYQINLYSGVEHGFAVRGNMSNKVEKYAKENAFLQALQWFEEHGKIDY